MADRAAARRPAVARSCSAHWREACDARLAVELGVAVLAAERAERRGARARSTSSSAQMDDALDDFAAYRQADVRFHIGARRGDRLAAASWRR